MSRTNTDWRAIRQWRDRQRYRRAGAILEAAKGGNPFKHERHYTVGLNAKAGDVKVYGPDGALREVVSVADWRRRYGDPFKRSRRREDDGETQRTAEPGEGQEDTP